MSHRSIMLFSFRKTVRCLYAKSILKSAIVLTGCGDLLVFMLASIGRSRIIDKLCKPSFRRAKPDIQNCQRPTAAHYSLRGQYCACPGGEKRGKLLFGRSL